MLVFKTYILIQNYFHHYLLQKSPIMLLFKECMYLNVLKEELNLKEDLEFKEFFVLERFFLISLKNTSSLLVLQNYFTNVLLCGIFFFICNN